MIAVITGDIIHSRKVNPELWLPNLKEYFQNNLSSDTQWEIYRGDSFQLEVQIEKSLEMAMCIKSLIKSYQTIDVRMSIGIGAKSFQGQNIKESNGSAYINSGEGFELLKNNTLQIKSPNQEFDSYFNTMLKLVSWIS